MTTVRLDDAAIRALSGSDDVRSVVMSVGDQVADRAAQSADVWSDEGFASIHAEAVKDGGEWTARVSWDEQHFYLLFFEVGTSEIPARPFLRPALEGNYTP